MTDESRVQKVPRTKIEDLPQAGEELSEEEASLAAGGATRLNVRLSRPVPVPEATQYANTCTAGDDETGSDTDYGTD